MVRSGDPRDHVSFVIRDLCIKLKHFVIDPTTPNPNPSLMELGSTFEDVIADGLANRYQRKEPDRFVRPGELVKDGLIGTPDLYDTVDAAMIEVKLTKMSSRHDVDSDKFWKYWVQLKAYCYMMSVTLGRLHIGFLNGDYRGGLEVDYQVWEEHFTNNELIANWRMLRSHHAILKAA